MKRNPPQASPEITSAPRAAQAEPRLLIRSDPTHLMQRKDGSLFLRTEEPQYFDGKKWREWKSIFDLKGAGINFRDNDPRRRLKKVEKNLTRAEARAWILDLFIPLEFHADFSLPLAGEYGTMPAVKEAAARIGITPDCLVCNAVEAFLKYVSDSPEEAARFPLINESDISSIISPKWNPTAAAEALFRRLYDEAVAAPFQECLKQLAALRDLVSAHPGFDPEYQALSTLLGDASRLTVLRCGYKGIEAA